MFLNHTLLLFSSKKYGLILALDGDVNAVTKIRLNAILESIFVSEEVETVEFPQECHFRFRNKKEK